MIVRRAGPLGPASLFSTLIPVLLGAQRSGPAVCPPVDEAVTRPDFFTFRAHLQSAIARRDAAAVLAVVDPKIRVSFGPDNGREAFERRWRPSAADSELWAELGAVLALGGRFQPAGSDTFVAPYTFACEADAFEDAIVTGANVRVRQAPSADAPVVAALSFAVVRRAKSDPNAEWTEVVLGDGRRGFIASRYVRSPAGYRAFFAKVSGSWRLQAFVAGD
jgi:hypothetical protein